MFNNYIILLLALIFLSACNPNGNLENSKDKILNEINISDSILNNEFYPSKVYITNDTIFNIEMELPELEFINETKMKIIREMSICAIIKYLDGFKGIMFTQYSKKHIGDEKYYKKKYLPSVSLSWLYYLEVENKTLYDFKNYIVKHIKTDKIYKFDGVIRGMYLMNGDGKTVPDNYEDYFKIIEQYSLECQGLLKGNYYREFLYRIRILAYDPVYFNDFDVNDVNYFLYYNNEYYKKNNLLLKDTLFYK